MLWEDKQANGYCYNLIVMYAGYYAQFTALNNRLKVFSDDHS